MNHLVFEPSSSPIKISYKSRDLDLNFINNLQNMDSSCFPNNEFLGISTATDARIRCNLLLRPFVKEENISRTHLIIIYFSRIWAEKMLHWLKLYRLLIDEEEKITIFQTTERSEGER